MTRKVSTAAARVLGAIVAYKAKHDGCPPTTREVARVLGICPSAVYFHLVHLREAGKIKGAGRNLKVEGAAWLSPDDAASLLAQADGVIITARATDPAQLDARVECSYLETGAAGRREGRARPRGVRGLDWEEVTA